MNPVLIVAVLTVAAGVSLSASLVVRRFAPVGHGLDHGLGPGVGFGAGFNRTEPPRPVSTRLLRWPLEASRVDALGVALHSPERLRRMALTQFGLTGGLGAVMVASVVQSPNVVNLVAGSVVCAGAWQVPLIAARRRSQQLSSSVDRELGDALGELVMGVEAGLTLETVMARYAERRDTPLADEFEQMSRTVKLGATRREALEAFEARCPTRTVKMFALAVSQNQSLGTPLAAVLRQQAATIRRHRRQAAEAAAAKLSMKMIFPTIFCILPVLMIVVVGPAIVRLLEVL